MHFSLLLTLVGLLLAATACRRSAQPERSLNARHLHDAEENARRQFTQIF